MEISIFAEFFYLLYVVYLYYEHVELLNKELNNILTYLLMFVFYYSLLSDKISTEMAVPCFISSRILVKILGFFPNLRQYGRTNTQCSTYTAAT